eukprot:7481250-Pyramimonas_sp.AAC.1
MSPTRSASSASWPSWAAPRRVPTRELRAQAGASTLPSPRRPSDRTTPLPLDLTLAEASVWPRRFPALNWRRSGGP